MAYSPPSLKVYQEFVPQLAGNTLPLGVVAADADLTAVNIVTGKNIFGVDGSAVVSTGDAIAANVLATKTFSKTGSAGLTGTMVNVGTQNITPSTTTHTITAGYHDGSGVVATDANLVTGNIKSGATIFGVAGKTEVVDTADANAVASEITISKTAYVNGVKITGTAAGLPLVSKTGQTISYDAAGAVVNPKVSTNADDGYYEKGVANTAPRFTDNGDGTVTDNNTELIWLKNANAFGTQIWATALTTCNTLANGTAGLTDGSVAGDWRLPNVNELQSLCNYGYVTPALSNAAGNAKWTAGDPFTGVQSGYYWSGTTYAGNTAYAWVVYLRSGAGSVYGSNKSGSIYVWPVRGGQ